MIRNLLKKILIGVFVRKEICKKQSAERIAVGGEVKSLVISTEAQRNGEICLGRFYFGAFGFSTALHSARNGGNSKIFSHRLIAVIHYFLRNKLFLS